MTKKTIILLIVVATMSLLLSSCMLALKAAGLWQDPKPETPESVRAFCKENDSYYDYLYMPKSDSSIAEMLRLGYNNIGAMEPFDRNQRQIFVNTVHGINGCPFTTDKDYQSQDTAVAYASADNHYFWDKLSYYQLVDKREGMSDLAENNQNYDFYLVSTYSKIIGKYATGVARRAHEASLIDSTQKVCVILLAYEFRGGKPAMKAINKERKKEIQKQTKEAKKAEKAAKKSK